jgi:rSAM/selenodomain-associated transferase 2
MALSSAISSAGALLSSMGNWDGRERRIVGMPTAASRARARQKTIRIGLQALPPRRRPVQPGVARLEFLVESDTPVMPGIAVIIPCLNETELLPATLESLHLAFDAAGATAQIIVADGGSEDNSMDIAKAEGCQLVNSEQKQRAHQLNLGAGAGDARTELLWFVHADTRVPIEAVKQLRGVMKNPHVLGGGFCRRFDSASLTLQFGSLLADFRGRLCNIFYGDQAMFVRRSAFEQLGGFDESLDVAEDLDFSLRLRELGKVATLRPPVIGSARRFEKLGPREQLRKDRDFVKAWMAERGWSKWWRGRRS